MMILASPAKVNLFLRILRRRSDGYHELASLFQTVDLCDILHVAFSDKDHLSCNNPVIPLDSSNLIWKAVNLFRQKTGKQFNLEIKLDKHIPIQAGLGGGSSNAATVLWAMNALHGYLVELTELQQWAGEIGSDVPFFLSQGTAYCYGRGELMRPLNPLPNQTVAIYMPQQGLSTPAVYKKLHLERLPSRCPEESLESFKGDSPNYYNDLEGPAFELMPSLLALKQHLMQAGFENVLLAGSGAALIGCGDVELCHSRVNDKEVRFQVKASFINRQKNQWYIK